MGKEQLILGRILRLDKVGDDVQVGQYKAVVIIAEITRLGDAHSPGGQPAKERLFGRVLEPPFLPALVAPLAPPCLAVVVYVGML